MIPEFQSWTSRERKGALKCQGDEGKQVGDAVRLKTSAKFCLSPQHILPPIYSASSRAVWSIHVQWHLAAEGPVKRTFFRSGAACGPKPKFPNSRGIRWRGAGGGRHRLESCSGLTTWSRSASFPSCLWFVAVQRASNCVAFPPYRCTTYLLIGLALISGSGTVRSIW